MMITGFSALSINALILSMTKNCSSGLLGASVVVNGNLRLMAGVFCIAISVGSPRYLKDVNPECLI